ncbi:reverse transcriptase domain-containing protein [Tanacetum coccineum]
MWYRRRDSGFELKAFADADYAGCHYTWKSTSGSAQFLGHRLVSWSSKKQKSTAISTTEVAPSESKKPDGSSYYTPHRLQWKNNMANGTNTAASKNRGRGAFHLYMDEFRGCNIAVSVQWDHRKAMSEENSSSHIDNSRNAKIPGPRWGTYFLKQQDNPTGMHDGLRTRSIAFRCHSGSRGKNQSSHPSEISRTNNCNRVHLNRGRTKGIM